MACFMRRPLLSNGPRSRGRIRDRSPIGGNVSCSSLGGCGARDKMIKDV